MLLIEDLQVKLGEQEVLRHIDLQINPGETHILFGPNGSGKTSLLMTIMGYPQYRVTAGKIKFKGVDITNLPINERANSASACPTSARRQYTGLRRSRWCRSAGRAGTSTWQAWLSR